MEIIFSVTQTRKQNIFRSESMLSLTFTALETPKQSISNPLN